MPMKKLIPEKEFHVVKKQKTAREKKLINHLRNSFSSTGLSIANKRDSIYIRLLPKKQTKKLHFTLENPRVTSNQLCLIQL